MNKSPTARGYRTSQSMERDMRRTFVIALFVIAVGNWLAGTGLVGQPAVSELMKRDVSPEGKAYLQKLQMRIPFGTNDFNLAVLREGMGSRREPTIKGVKLST
jgi:hypothetical protein